MNLSPEAAAALGQAYADASASIDNILAVLRDIGAPLDDPAEVYLGLSEIAIPAAAMSRGQLISMAAAAMARVYISAPTESTSR